MSIKTPLIKLYFNWKETMCT